MLRKKLYNLLPAPNYRAKLIAGWQNTNSIIDAMKVQHAINLQDAKKIAKYFQGNTERETAQNIFDFLKTEIKYEVESAENQTTKSMSRFLADGKGDCKHFALFSCTILQSLGYRPLYRFAGYKGKDIQHVYCYLPKSNTILDAVLVDFDTEKKPTLKKDIDMSLYRLSGINDTSEIGAVSFSSIAKNIKNATASASNVVKKAASQIPAAADKITQSMKTLGLAPSRNAFLALVELNVHGFATDLKKVVNSKGMDGLKFWYDLGGDRTALENSINRGAEKKKIFGVNEENASYNELFKGYSADGVIGVEPTSTATLLASAAPIVVAVVAFLKKELGADGSTEPTGSTDAIISAATKGFTAATGLQLPDVVFKKDAGSTTKQNTITPDDIKPVSKADATKVAEAAVASGSGVDIQTIKKIAAETGLPPTGVPPTGIPAVDGFFNKNKKYILAGAAALVVGYFIIKKK